MRLTEGQRAETLVTRQESLHTEQRDTVQPSDPKHRTTLGNSPPLPSKFWGMFDLFANFKSITETRRINSAVQVFELMRVMAMVWIIWAHEYV